MNISSLIPDMLNAAAGVLRDKWPVARDYAETEFKKLNYDLYLISVLYEEGKITERQAQLHLAMQKNGMMAVLLTIEGLGLLMVEEAINAAFAVIKEAVNSSIKFPLL